MGVLTNLTNHHRIDIHEVQSLIWHKVKTIRASTENKTVAICKSLLLTMAERLDSILNENEQIIFISL